MILYYYKLRIMKVLKNVLLFGLMTAAMILISCGEDEDSAGEITGTLIGTRTGLLQEVFLSFEFCLRRFSVLSVKSTYFNIQECGQH